MFARRKLSLLFSILLMATALLATACTKTQKEKIESALNQHRGGKAWLKSSRAFKKIMREFVHGGKNLSDAQLDRDFELFLTLTEEDVRKFIQGQSCMPIGGKGDDQYYIVNTGHQRHDDFFAPDQPRKHIKGSGSKHAHASFSANLLLEKYPAGPGKKVPSRITTKGSPFPSWQTLRDSMTKEASFKKKFIFEDPAQATELFTRLAAYDWDKMNGDVFTAPRLHGGEIFSPALFAVWVLREDGSDDPGVFVVVSANAQGDPETPYVGLIGHEGQYKSQTGFAFTYLSTAKNLLNYRYEAVAEEPLSFRLWIDTAYPDHPDKPYLTVRSSFLPAVSKARVSHFKNGPATRLIMMVRKGALMRDLVKLYYPHSSDVELWKDVGAVHGTGLKEQLEAAGLSIAADLFDKNLWLEKPKVGGTFSHEFKLPAGLEERCAELDELEEAEE